MTGCSTSMSMVSEHSLRVNCHYLSWLNVYVNQRSHIPLNTHTQSFFLFFSGQEILLKQLRFCLRKIIMKEWEFLSFFLSFSFIFISWRLITLQYCSDFCHTLTWISHGFTCIPHPNPPSRLPLHPIPLGLPSAPALSTCLMHPAWAGGLFQPW